METRYLDLVDFLLIAEAALGVEVGVLQRTTSLHLAESALAAPAAEFGGTEFYPETHLKAAILCSRLVRNHPLPDGNKRLRVSVRGRVRRAQRVRLATAGR